ncbi:MAG TPA: hydrogenase [Thermoanaerobaculia bacterium]|nr:hydrogenase [Thermoanaerobaculia bacterium]
MNRLQIQFGFVLILLALCTGFGMPLFTNTRLGLAAHVVGITGGLVLIALGSLAGSFLLGARAAAVMMWSWVYAAYANWFASLLGAVTGASRLTPIAGAGTVGDAVAETIVSFLLQSLAVAALTGTVLAVWGFRKPRTVAATAPIGEGLTAPPA